MKKLLCLLLAAAMLLGMLAGCGSSSGSDSETETESAEEAAEDTAEEAAETEDTSAEEAEETEEEAEEADEAEAESTEEAETEAEEAAEETTASAHQYNFPNSEAALLDYTNEYSLPLTEETETLTWMRTSINLMGDLANLGLDEIQDFEFMQYWQEITNVNIDFYELNFTTSQEMMNIAFASGDFSDIVTDMQYSTGDEAAYNDEVIIDLGEYLEEYAPNYYYMIHSNEEYYDIFTTDGMILAFESPYENFINNQGLAIRSDWLEELGLEAPTTYDEIYDVLVAFKQNYTEYPLYMSKMGYITGLVVGYDVETFDASGEATELPFYVDNGEVKCSLIEDGYRDFLAEMNRWYEAGLFDPDFMSIEYNPVSTELTTAVNEGEIGLWNTSGEGVDNYSVEMMCIINPTANEDGMDHITSTSLTVDSVATYVTTCCENIELAMRFLDYMYSEDGILFYNYGFEGVDYTIDENGTPQFTEAVINNEYGLSVANYTRIRCGYAVFSSMLLRYRTADLNSDIVNEAWDVWSSNIDGTMTLPSNVSLTTEETETISYYATDIITYASETVPQFIMGTKSMDEWDDFVAQLKTMNIEACIAAEQSAYDRCVG